MSLFLLLFTYILANDGATCKRCHPIIDSEFQHSFHKKSSIYEDTVHKAVWDKHPAKQKGNYTCAKCHTPDKTDTHAGITCISCHQIKAIKEHPKSNENVYESKAKTFYSAQKGRETEKVVFKEEGTWLGINKTTTGSPYHSIDYTHQDYYTGNVCMGCHSHKENGHGFSVCQTDKGKEASKENCITCHMPKVQGSATTIRQSKTHAFHGFSGARNAPEMLTKYVDISYKKTENGFDVRITNNAPHHLLTHPLRVVALKTTLTHNGKQTALKTHTFVKILGHKGKPAMPWIADEIFKDNMLKGNETRVIHFDTALHSDDTLDVRLGFHIVNPKAAPKLGLDKDKTLTKFTLLKHQYFKIP